MLQTPLTQIEASTNHPSPACPHDPRTGDSARNCETRGPCPVARTALRCRRRQAVGTGRGRPARKIHGRLRETHIGALLGTGAIDRALAELEIALAEEPLRERLWAYRMAAYRDSSRATPRGRPSSSAQHRFTKLLLHQPPSAFVTHVNPGLRWCHGATIGGRGRGRGHAGGPRPPRPTIARPA